MEIMFSNEYETLNSHSFVMGNVVVIWKLRHNYSVDICLLDFEFVEILFHACHEHRMLGVYG